VSRAKSSLATSEPSSKDRSQNVSATQKALEWGPPNFSRTSIRSPADNRRGSPGSVQVGRSRASWPDPQPSSACAAKNSVFGTKRTCQSPWRMSAVGGEADIERCYTNNDEVYPPDVALPRPGEGALPRDSCGFSGRWGPAWRCLVAKCFNGNNGDEEKPRKTSKCA
jgi:hypothetical protein